MPLKSPETDLYFGWWIQTPDKGSWDWHEQPYGDGSVTVPAGAVGMVLFEKPRSSPARAPGFEPGELGSTPSGASKQELICDAGCGVMGWLEISPKLLGGPCPRCKDGNILLGPIAQPERALPSEGKDPGSTPGGASRKD